MDRLLSALVLGVYLVSCAPALLPPAGSAEAGGRTDGWGAGRALSAELAAAKGELPDVAREKRLVEAWQQKTLRQDDELKQALREHIPEMIRRYDGLRPAHGFEPQNVWRKTPHTYVYQVSRGDAEITEGEYKGESFYDVRQVGFLFDSVEELTRTETAYVGKAELLKPFFMRCFGENAIQRAAGNSDPDFAACPLVKAILDRGLNPADYVSFEAYYDLYLYERAPPPRQVIGDEDSQHYYATVTLRQYNKEINREHPKYLKQYELYAADTESLLGPGEARLDREYIAGQGIDFESADFEERLNGFSVRKSVFENVGDIVDGYWEALKDVPLFRRAFERAVGNLAAYLAAEGVVADVNLPTCFKCRYTIPVYRCRAPYLAVCGAAQALSYGWVQAPVVGVQLDGGCWLDVPRISSADSNRLGIQYASFETGRGNGQKGFSGYGFGEGVFHKERDLNEAGRPDRFSMGALRLGSDSFAYFREGVLFPENTAQPRNAFAEAYLQCNYPYKVFSRTELRGMTKAAAAEAVMRQTGGSVPRYWQDRFHHNYDDRNAYQRILLIIDIILIIVTVALYAYQIYDLYMFYQAMEAFEVLEAPSEAEIFRDIVLRTGTREAWSNISSGSGYGYVIYVGNMDRIPNANALLHTVNQYGFRYIGASDPSIHEWSLYLVPDAYFAGNNGLNLFPLLILGNATARGAVGGLEFAFIMQIINVPPMIATQQAILAWASALFVLRAAALTAGWIGLRYLMDASRPKSPAALSAR
ncbi:hypothetical protein [Treponema endosymbiont of Eucomonympha sp.]|uniref:hypothetical protein n=1 Tax=Treponema endosymbiont of Eucomonympha sp. TaxID=1580831 RepID=UPI0007825C23|nr:hypothetical protein [Treponema endosymbiont of Eucomonympha sp.]